MESMKGLVVVTLLALLAACQPDAGQPQVSRALQLSADGKSLWVVNTDSDSISQIDVGSRTLVREIALGTQAPAVQSDTADAGPRYEPFVRPRALTLVDKLAKVYVAGQAANAIVVVDTSAGSILTRIAVAAEPVAVVASPDGKSVFAVSHEGARVGRIDTATDTVVANAALPEHPWGASLRADGSKLYVTEFLRNPGVEVLDPTSLTGALTALPDQAPDPSGDQLIPNGTSRGLYSVVPEPGSGELWVPHLLLAVGTPQPQLDFQTTVFPSFALLAPGGATLDTRLLFRPSSLTGTPDAGAFSDVVSGPRDVAFTPDGNLALVADAQSEDVLVFDTHARVEVALVRPVRSTLLEGIVVDALGQHAYVLGRNSHDVTVLDIAEGAGGTAPLQPSVTVDGDAIGCLAAADPMPADYRRGQRLFFSSNSSAFPITQNFWMACSTCHLEGQTDAVTWKFAEGPRDTPSNAGGPVNTGFLFRQATRNAVVDYDQTIMTEQGGDYHRTNALQLPDLQALSDFTNYAIPFPQNPNLTADGGLTAAQAHGQALFQGAGCEMCHLGNYFTDSGGGNPGLSFSGPVLLHDMSALTCNFSTVWPDQSSTDLDGGLRTPCNFDTPTLRGIFASPPYLHDGSAATLADAVARMPDGGLLGDADRADLVSYLQTL